MRKLVSSISAIFVLAMVINANAQAVLNVSYESARIYWNLPKPPSAGVGETKWYVMNCGVADIKLDFAMLKNDGTSFSIAVKNVAPTIGTYNCKLYAANDFGLSPPGIAPTFNAGDAPAAPESVRIVVTVP